MRRIYSLAICFLLSALCVLNFGLIGCGNEKYSSTSFTCFNTDVYVYANVELDANTINEIKSICYDLESQISLTLDGSCIRAFNQSQTTTNLTLDATYLIKRAKECHQLTGGAFNPAVYPLTVLYGFSADTFDPLLSPYAPPAKSIVQKYLPIIDFDKVTLREVDKTLTKEQPEIQIDLGGIAKGYAVDKIKALLTSKGASKGFINVGGSSIYVLGYDKGLSVKHPRNLENYILKINTKDLSDAPLSTSGDYVRYYLDVNENRYCHIIDSKTGLTANTGLVSVTVIADNVTDQNKKSALFTDAISTSLMIMEKDDMINFVKQNLVGFSVYAVYNKDGTKKIITNADTDNFTVIDTDYKVFKF